MKKFILLVIIAIIITYCGFQKSKDKLNEAIGPELSNSYLNQKFPGLIPEIISQGLVSDSNSSEYGGHFSPDGSEFYFTRFSKEIKVGIYCSKLINGKWTEPNRMPFSDKYPGGESCMSFDGTKLYYTWESSDTANPKQDIYVVVREGDSWGVPYTLTDINLGERRVCPSIAKNGNLYYSGNIDNPEDKDIYVSRLINGKYTKPVNLGSTINTEHYEEHVFIAPDESYILWDSYRPFESEGTGYVWISFKKDNGEWCDAIPLGIPGFKDAAYWYPTVTPDGKYLVLACYHEGDNNLYWMSSEKINNLKPN